MVGQHKPRSARPVGDAIALEEMIARQDIAGTRDHPEMPKAHRAVIAHLDVRDIGVEGDGRAQRRVDVLLIRQELAAVDLQPLTPLTGRGNAPILGSGEKTILDLERQPVTGQVQTRTNARTKKLDISHDEPLEVQPTKEIEQVFEPPKSISLGDRCRAQCARESHAPSSYTHPS